MDKRESLLGLDFETVANFIDRPDDSYFSVGYLQEILRHLKVNQPELIRTLGSQIFPEVEKSTHFLAGALSTYDLIVSADEEFWGNKKIDKSVIHVVRENVVDSIVFSVKDDEALDGFNLDLFYQKLSKDSPDFVEWVEYQASRINGTRQINDFLSGVILIAMPFFMIREAEELERRFFVDKTIS